MTSFSTIPQMFLAQTERLAAKPLFWVKRQGGYQPISWGEARKQVQALAGAFRALGLQPGDRVAILSENRPEWALVDLAVLFCRGVTVPLYATSTAKEAEYILRDAGAKIVCVSTAEQLAKLAAVRTGLAGLSTVITFDPAPQPLAGVMPLSQALSTGPKVAVDLHALAQAARPEEIVTLIYTSGTTGEPKGVMLTHQTFLSNCECCRPVIPVGESDRHLSFLPLSHVFERMAGYYFILVCGAEIAYAENLETVPHNLLETHPTILLGVPRFFEKLKTRLLESLQKLPPAKQRLFRWAMAVGRAKLQAHEEGKPLSGLLRLQLALAHVLIYRKIRQRLGGRIRFCIAGGAPLGKDLAEFFYSLGVVILEGYGLTETSTVISVNALDALKFGTVGRPIPGVEVKIADEDGEILTRSRSVMTGYYHREEETREALRDGWFHTGDIGHLDADGFLVITDRKKELIVTAGGKKVPPSFMENLFKSDALIADAFVYGERRPYLAALIVPKLEALKRAVETQGVSCQTDQELCRHPKAIQAVMGRINALQRDLASYHQVKKCALLDQPFSREAGELTPTLKIKRQIVSERYRDLIEQLYQ